MSVSLTIKGLKDMTPEQRMGVSRFLRRMSNQVQTAKPKAKVWLRRYDPATDSTVSQTGSVSCEPAPQAVEDPRLSGLNLPNRDTGPGGVLDPNN